MLALARQASAAKRRSVPQSIAAPSTGWNTRDPFEAMEPTDAVLLDNWYPDFGGPTIRKGTNFYADSMGPFPVETLAAYSVGVTNKFLAACGGSIFDISTPGSVSTPLGSDFSSNRWQTVTFNSKLFWVNGADNAQIYDGTTLAATGFTGVATSTLRGVGVFHNRLYFWSTDDASFWYGGVNAISGALNNFDLSTVQQEGGTLIAVEVLSYDGGTGIDSYTCFFMSSGELLLYSGTDPSNANNWALVGRYMLPPPIDVRAIVRYGGDIYIATTNDHQQLSKILIALKLGETPPRTKISGAATAAHNAGQNLFGWQAIYYPVGTRLLFNIPNPDGTFSQHVYNTSVQSWCRFRGINASCWAVYRDKLYFGAANGAVFEADVGSTDISLAGVRPIVAASQQAWQSFNTPLTKRLTAARIILQTTNQGGSYLFEVGIDYHAPSIITPAALPAQGATWGEETWGNFFWTSLAALVDTNWRLQGGAGSAFSWGVVANSSAPTTWVRTDLLLEPGNML